jgi:hypothetical protein
LEKSKFLSKSYNSSIANQNQNEEIKWSRDLSNKFNRNLKSKFNKDKFKKVRAKQNKISNFRT